MFFSPRSSCLHLVNSKQSSKHSAEAMAIFGEGSSVQHTTQLVSPTLGNILEQLLQAEKVESVPGTTKYTDRNNFHASIAP